MRKYGVIQCSLAAVRKAPSDKSEMVNQMLFGELVAIHRVLHQWVYIESGYDGYSGWINKYSLILIEDDQLAHFEKKNSIVLPRLNRAIASGRKGSYIHMVPGSLLPSYDENNGEFILGDQHYRLENPVEQEMMRLDREQIIKTSLTFLNAPYLWGGRSPFGIDSPGLLQVIGKIHGIFLPREADQQVAIGSTVNFVEEAEPGDLAFFDDDGRGGIHAGIITEMGRVLHVSESVRIDTLDHQGIFRKDTGEYTHSLRVIRNSIGS